MKQGGYKCPPHQIGWLARTVRIVYVNLVQSDAGRSRWQDMKTSGILTAEDRTKPADVAREIALCDDALRRLPS